MGTHWIGQDMESHKGRAELQDTVLVHGRNDRGQRPIEKKRKEDLKKIPK